MLQNPRKNCGVQTSGRLQSYSCASVALANRSKTETIAQGLTEDREAAPSPDFLTTCFIRQNGALIHGTSILARLLAFPMRVQQQTLRHELCAPLCLFTANKCAKTPLLKVGARRHHLLRQPPEHRVHEYKFCPCHNTFEALWVFVENIGNRAIFSWRTVDFRNCHLPRRCASSCEQQSCVLCRLTLSNALVATRKSRGPASIASIGLKPFSHDESRLCQPWTTGTVLRETTGGYHEL